MPQAARSQQIKSVIRVSSGNFLEMYDFTVFGYYAAQIGATFFAKNDTSALLKAFMTFGAGFMMRPLGAIVLGAYLDRKGRRAGLLLTLALMSIGTLSIACMPGYRSLGLMAPIMIVIGRLTQGFSAGVELGGVSVYLSEIATPGHKGFDVSWHSASMQQSCRHLCFDSRHGAQLPHLPADMDRWGWRIPLLVGCLIIPFLFYPSSIAGGDRCVSCSGASSVRCGSRSDSYVKLAHGIARSDARYDDHRVVLPYHCLCTGLRHEGSQAPSWRYTSGYTLCRHLKPILAPAYGRTLR